MAIAFSILLLVIMIVLVGLLFPTGLWGNMINLVNVVLAALVATNYWEPLSTWITRKAPSLMYVADLFVLWVMFAGVYFALRSVTEFASKVKVRFPKMLERIGNVFFASWIAWVFVCFLTMTLHTAPMGREFLFGGFKPEDGMMFGFYPDRLWLGFVQKLSLGSLATNHAFDPDGSFLYRYAERRAQFEKQVGVLAQPQ